MTEEKPNWIFAYGSLMWRPGFDFMSRHQGLLYGYHRGFSVYSYHHRGTPQAPGLVLGLDRGGSCCGVAYKVDTAHWANVISYLREREQVTMVYREVICSVRLHGAGNEKIKAVTYVVDRSHEQYAGKLAHEEQVRLILRGEGVSGKNPDYLESTLDHLKEMKIKDVTLERISHDVKHHLRQQSPRR